MWNNYWLSGPWQFNAPAGFKFLLPFIILDVVLKGFALWRAAGRKQLYWFIALIVVNSLGILPAIYLLITSSKKK